jgi:hypothetical protein
VTRAATRGRLAIFALVCVAAVAAVAWSLVRARQEAATPASPGAGAPAAVPALSAPPATPFVLVRHLAPGSGWSRLALAPLAVPDGPRFVTPLTCVRGYMAGSRGLCLASNGADGRAIVFDTATFAPTQTLVLTGPPSRARVSRDGRLGAVTVFESGHSYAEEGFSTRTTILDLETGTPYPDLETFAIRQDGARVRRIDINFWGVTFIPDTRRFYATLAYGGTPYLVEGDLDRRDVRVLAPHVECPSLSPDGTRLAFKRADGLRWRLWVRDIASGSEHAIGGETRSIDDQVEWLDDRHVLYQFPSDEGNNLYVVHTDDGTPARRFMSEAWSPAVVR